MPDISAVLTGHCEGLLAGPSIKSFLAAIEEARKHGLSVEPIIVLDRPDKLTAAVFEEADDLGGRVVMSSAGDPGLSRNRGVQESAGQFVAFLDADDLWSNNWLLEAHTFCNASPARMVAHSEVNVVFGRESVIWVHVDSTDASFDPGYLVIGNYWDALSFARREVYEKHPFRGNDLPAGWGHEDWHWNCQTLLDGYAHRPVPGTVHFKRKREKSQMSHCQEWDVLPWVTRIALFDHDDTADPDANEERSQISGKTI